jgi:hypothetical protein
VPFLHDPTGPAILIAVATSRLLALVGFGLAFLAGGALLIWAVRAPHDLQHAHLAPVGAPVAFVGFIGFIALLEGHRRRER